MDINSLRFLSVEELTTKKQAADLAEKQAREALACAAQEADAYAVALACHKHGAWIGDTVQVKGRAAGKDNPTGVLAGIDGPGFYNGGWPLVRLHRKDGTLPDASTRIYGEKPLTKID